MAKSLETITRVFKSFFEDENGATAIEYSLIAGLLFLAIVGSVRAVTTSTSTMYDELADDILSVN